MVFDRGLTKTLEVQLTVALHDGEKLDDDF